MQVGDEIERKLTLGGEGAEVQATKVLKGQSVNFMPDL